MLFRAYILTLLTLSLLGNTSCQSTSGKISHFDSSAGLKTHFSKIFPIGVSVSAKDLMHDDGRFIIHHFNTITPENAMKMSFLQPSQGEYHWNDADSIAQFARAHQMRLRGHTLLWHRSTPQWVFLNKDGSAASRDTIMRRLELHIRTLVKRYKGLVYAWDVLNEVIADDSTQFYRNSILLQRCGTVIYEKVFEWAHEEDPSALLFYNDYNEINAIKRSKIISFVNQLRAKGIPIHGIGLQSHWNIYSPTAKQLETTLQQFTATKLKLHITELDLSIHRWQDSVHSPAANMNAQQAISLLQSRQYRMIFQLLAKYRNQISNVTFWNTDDGRSWLNNYPIKNRGDAPTLFNIRKQPKSAFWEVVNAAHKFNN